MECQLLNSFHLLLLVTSWRSAEDLISDETTIRVGVSVFKLFLNDLVDDSLGINATFKVKSLVIISENLL